MVEATRYVTPVFRLSFPELFEAQRYQDGEPKFGLSAVWDPKKFTAKDRQLWNALGKALDAESKTRFKKSFKDLPGNIKRGIRDGAEKSDLEGYGEGTKFANITSKMRPGIVDSKKDRIARDIEEREKWEAEGKQVANEVGNEAIYPGCYCRATVSVYSYDNVGKGIALGLFNLQKVADGERLDSRTDAENDFDDDIDDQWLDAGGEGTDPDDIPF